MRLIDADKLPLDIEREDVDDAPTIDAVEVVHGEWIEVHDWLQIPQKESGTYRCSACGQVMKYPWNYCPNCGAKMDGERRDPCSSQDS